MKNKNIIIIGGSGFLGQSLTKELLKRSYEVTILTRSLTSKKNNQENVQFIEWNGKYSKKLAPLFNRSFGVINFAGKSVNCLYTEKNKKEIIRSRVDSVNAVEAAIAVCSEPPSVWIQAGSLAIFGDSGDRFCEESSAFGEGFSVEVCKAWENAFIDAQTPRTRKVFLRIGFVLGKKGGALEPLSKLTRYFLGGTIGSGKQYVSWIHQDDFNQMIIQSLERDDIKGIYNATGPSPTTNADFMRELRSVFKRPWSPPTPAFAVYFGARFIMRTEPSLALTGRRALPRKFEEQGFRFQYSSLKKSLQNILIEK